MNGWYRAKRFFKSSPFRRKIVEIDPDEILLDAYNLPEFNQSRFEGRLEKPIHRKTFSMFGLFCMVVGVALLGRIFFLQVFEGEAYAQKSENNRLHHSVLFAERGVLFDRNGVELAWNSPMSTSTMSTSTDSFAVRSYYKESGFAHILGYVSLPQKDKYGVFYKTASEGIAGAEKTFNRELSGHNGVRMVETDALGNILSASTLSLPKDGQSITLSIDSRMQASLHKAIADLAERVSFRGGTGMVMDIHTGELLVYTNYPEYSSEVMTRGQDREMIASYQSSSSKPFLNRGIGGQFTPGSIVKAFLAYAALEEDVIDPEKTIVSTGVLRFPNPYNPSQFTLLTDGRAHGEVDMRRALAVSSNIYFYYIGGGFGSQKGLGITNIERYVRLFGLGSHTGIELEGEAEGTIPNPAWKAKHFDDGIWRIGDTYNTAIGQYGFQITPIQALRAVALLGNGDTLVTPSIRRGGSGKSERVELTREHLHVVHEGMRQAVLDGTARALNTPYVEIAAKTGTAEVGPKNQFVNSWVMGFFPYENPKYAFVVMMEYGPRANLFGASLALRQMLDEMHTVAPEYFD